MSADPQTLVSSLTEYERIQQLLRCYTHILTKESEKAISRTSRISEQVEDTLASRAALGGEIRLWERNMVEAVHSEAERCIRDLNTQVDQQLARLRDAEEELQSQLVALNEVCLKLNLLTVQTLTENNAHLTMSSVRNEINEQMEKLHFLEEFQVKEFSIVPNVLPGHTLLNVRKCPPHLNEKQTVLKPVSVEKSVSLLKTIKSRTKGDMVDPVIGDMVVVSHGDIVVVCDWKNKCLKSFYKSHSSRLAMSFKSPCSSRDLQSEVDCVPWHLAAADTTVAVTTNHHQILFVDVCPSLVIKSRIPVNKFYHGIRLINKTSLAVSYSERNNILVDVLSHDGCVLHTISTAVVGDVWNTCLNVTPDDDVHIGSRSGVSCIDQQGVTKWVFPSSGEENLLRPVGVCWSGHDRLIVVDNTRRVISIDLVSAETTVLLSRLSGIVEPTCVYVTSSLLCVCEWRSGKIKMFNMNKKTPNKHKA